MRLLLSLCLFPFLFAAAAAIEAPWPFHKDTLTVNTTYGPVKGLVDKKNGIVTFHDIPFATPPVDDLRFRRPIPPKKWEDPVDCTGVSCFTFGREQNSRENLLDFFQAQPLKICPQVHVGSLLYGGTEDW